MNPIRHHDSDTGHALMCAILANPGDTLARLVFADWLEEGERMEACRRCNGGGLVCEMGISRCPACKMAGVVSNGQAERAEFIRLDCEPGGIGEHDSQRLFHRYNAERWFGDLYSHGFVTVAPRFRHEDGLTTSWRAVVADGFVGTVRCPLGWWAGVDCERCGGGWEVNRGDGVFVRVACPPCHGTGRTPGHGAAVVSRHPVVKVVVTDREPWRFDFHGEYGWFRGDCVVNYNPQPDGRRVGVVNSVPSEVFDAFPRRYGDQTEAYPTREAAVEALSRALVDLARAEAGLPPINWEVTP